MFLAPWVRLSLSGPLHSAVKSSQRCSVDEEVGLRSNQTLFMDTEICISYHFHISQNVLVLILPHPQLFKYVNTILSSHGCTKSGAGWIWLRGRRVQTPEPLLPFPSPPTCR